VSSMVVFRCTQKLAIDSKHVLPVRGGAVAEQLAFVQDVARGVLGRMGAVYDEGGAVNLLRFGIRLSTPGDNAGDDEAQV
jgi:hypothetical protein